MDLLFGKKRRVKTPTILQMEATECGAASLGIILAYYGCYISLEELRERCGVSRDGSKVSDILSACQHYGMTGNGFIIKPENQDDPVENIVESLVEIGFPFIVFWEFNHFLVIEGIKGNIVYLNDPATGPRTVTLEEFSKSFVGVVIKLTQQVDFEKRGSPPSLLIDLWDSVYPSLSAVIFIAIMSLFLVIPGLFIPAVSKLFIDNVIVRHLGNWITPLIFCLFAMLFLQAFMFWFSQKQLIRLYTKISLTTTAKFFWHILHLPVEFFNRHFAGDICERIKSNTLVASLVSSNFGSTFVSLITAVFFGIILFQISDVLTYIVFVTAFLYFLSFILVSRALADGNKQLQQESAKLYGVTMNGLQLIETIKTQGLENEFFCRWAGFYTKMVNITQKFSVSLYVSRLVPEVLLQISSISILAVGVLQIIYGQMTIGTFFAYSSLMVSFLSPISSIIGNASVFKTAEANLDRINDVLKYKTDKRFIIKQENKPHDFKTLSGSVSLSHVSFGYNQLKQAFIDDFSIDIKPGSRVAFVGTTGSGKSTIAKLIAGIYWPWMGEILFDGKKIQDIEKAVVRHSIGIVSQDIFLFEGTLRDNLTLWDPLVSDEKLIKACIDACIYDDIKERENGLLSYVTEGGGNFSTGQKQRIEIARALVNDPSILILDEAYSSLDPKTELEIDNNLRKRGCACIIVAHRLSTIRDCDEIIVLRKGKVLQRGSHNELMLKGGYYASLISGEPSTDIGDSHVLL